MAFNLLVPLIGKAAKSLINSIGKKKKTKSVAKSPDLINMLSANSANVVSGSKPLALTYTGGGYSYSPPVVPGILEPKKKDDTIIIVIIGLLLVVVAFVFGKRK